MPLYPPSPNSGAGSSGTSGSPAAASTTQVGGVNAGNLVSEAVDASGNQYVDLLDGSGNAITSQVSGSKRALDVGIDVAGVQVDPRAIRALTTSDAVTASQGGTWNVTNVSGTVSLPTGASTAANQTTANSSLSSIDGKLTHGQVTAANSVPVVPASDYIPPAPADITGSGSIIALNGTVALATHGIASALFTLSGTWVASVQFQGMAPDGTWSNLSVALVPSGNAFSSTAVSANGTYRITSGSSYTQLQAVATAFTSGPIVVNITASTAPAVVQVIQLNAQNLQTSNFANWAAQANKLYTFSTDFNLPTNGTETVAILFKNPSGSGKTYSLRYLTVATNGTTSQGVILRMYANPTTSANGSAVTVSSTNIGGGAAAATATPFTGPTVSANGTRFEVVNVIQGSSGGNPLLLEFDGRFVLNANNTILLTGQPSANNISMAVSLVWAEL